MLLLFETAAGFALFKVNKEDKLEQSNVRDSAQPGEASEAAFNGAAADLSHGLLLLLLLLPSGLGKGLRDAGQRQEGAFIYAACAAGYCLLSVTASMAAVAVFMAADTAADQPADGQAEGVQQV